MASVRPAAAIFIFVVAIYVGINSAGTGSGQWAVDMSCGQGWLKAMNNCYIFNTKDLLTWDEARTECSLLDSDLMIVGSKEEMNWIKGQTEAYTTDIWWVGLKYSGNSWQWMQYGGDNTLM